jgi:hypothetical protein
LILLVLFCLLLLWLLLWAVLSAWPLWVELGHRYKPVVLVVGAVAGVAVVTVLGAVVLFLMLLFLLLVLGFLLPSGCLTMGSIVGMTAVGGGR